MDDLETKLGEILSNPQMMQQIMGLAQSLGQASGNTGANAPPSVPDLSAMQAISGVLSQSNMDAQQRNLLNALSPYLNQERIRKLEKAMRAAKIAQQASCLLGENGMKLL